MSCISGEEALVYIAAYLTDISRKEPDAKFSLQELGQNMLAGGISGGLLGGGGAVAGGINTTAEKGIEIYGVEGSESLQNLNTQKLDTFEKTGYNIGKKEKEAYSLAIETGELTPLADFKLYSEVSNQMDERFTYVTGGRSVKFRNDTVEVSVNPDTGTIIQVNPVHSKRKKQ